jgi:hypothetical protein
VSHHLRTHAAWSLSCLASGSGPGGFVFAAKVRSFIASSNFEREVMAESESGEEMGGDKKEWEKDKQGQMRERPDPNPGVM